MATRKKSATNSSSINLELIPVEDNKHLGRDPNSKAILNTNKKDYMRAVQARRNNANKVDEIQQLKTQVAELSDLVKQLLGKVE
jgi:hypothetical protein